jgi:hypothetical protein
MRVLAMEEDVVHIVQDNPSASTCRISSAVDSSQIAVWHTPGENQLYPFQVQPV